MYTDFSDIKEKSKVLIKPSPSCVQLMGIFPFCRKLHCVQPDGPTFTGTRKCRYCLTIGAGTFLRSFLLDRSICSKNGTCNGSEIEGCLFGKLPK